MLSRRHGAKDPSVGRVRLVGASKQCPSADRSRVLGPMVVRGMKERCGLGRVLEFGTSRGSDSRNRGGIWVSGFGRWSTIARFFLLVRDRI